LKVRAAVFSRGAVEVAMRILVCVLLAVLALSPGPSPVSLFSVSRAQARDAGQSLTEKLILETADGPRTLEVEVARDPASRERGLMYRRHLPANRGMLFDFDKPQTVLMWMKNTYIPLDMIFISRDGKVTHIEENTEPLSEAVISSQGPAYAVLEVNAGVARELGLKRGDRVRHPMFGK
jgi:uncharacterized membrane protein (UPF0127 family)